MLYFAIFAHHVGWEGKPPKSPYLQEVLTFCEIFLWLKRRRLGWGGGNLGCFKGPVDHHTPCLRVIIWMGQLPCRQYGYSAEPTPKKVWKIWQARQGNKSIEKLHFGKPSKITLENLLENYLKQLRAHSLQAKARPAQNNTCLHNLCCPPKWANLAQSMGKG